jgi:hypothetical protein
MARTGGAAVTAVLLTASLTGVAAARDSRHAVMTPMSGFGAAAAVGAAAAFAQPDGNGGVYPPPVNPSSADPYSPAVGHSYRHGVLPTIGRQREMRSWTARHPAALASSSLNVTYGGGFTGPAVMTGHEKVYLVFLGSQWGAQRTGPNRDVALSGDPSGEAPYVQQLFKGLGTGGERWSGVMTQYCGDVSYNTEFCPANSLHVSYPDGGTLAGVWVDESAASPTSATGEQLGAAAVAAAAHFGNTTAASNRDASYVILSPTGANPDGFNTPSGQFCAWHDDSADPNLPGGPVASPLDVAFTNMPYVTDAGLNCGVNFINGGLAGLLDGVSIVVGHEYAETITDQYPPAGWTDTAGAETGDLCAWNPPGPSGTNNLTLPTGTFAMQSIWGNDASGDVGGCEFSHPIVTNNWVLNGGFETGTLANWTASGATSVAMSGVHSGRFAARVGQAAVTSGSSRIAQTFTARGTHLSFWYDVTCRTAVAQSWTTASLTDNTAHTTVTVLPRTCLSHSGWLRISWSVTAGHSYTLALASRDAAGVTAGNGISTLLDDVANS